MKKTTLLVLICLFVMIQQVHAHQPSGIDLDYNPVTKMLTATITHPVEDGKKHYIAEVDIAVNGENVIRPTKSSKGKRVISHSPTTVKVLKIYRENVSLMRLELGTMLKDDDLIFSHWDSSLLLPDSVSHAWTKLTRRLSIKTSRLHSARHIHASLMLKQGNTGR